MQPLLLFDFDGVVADSFEVFSEVFRAACTEIGFHHLDSDEAILKLFEGNVPVQLLKAGFPLWRIKKLSSSLMPRIVAANRRIEAFDGMPTLLTELAQTFPTYVISSNNTDFLQAFIERHEIQGIRDVLGADKEPSKVKKIKQVCALHPDREPFFIGDTKGDMVEGRAARVVTIAVTWGWHPVETLLAGDPDHTVDSPEELRAFFMGEEKQ